jgi:hypothetical protein
LYSVILDEIVARRILWTEERKKGFATMITTRLEKDKAGVMTQRGPERAGALQSAKTG